jgi:small-conductance mechanosensitive channel
LVSIPPEPAVRLIERDIEGFFALLPTLAVATVVFLLILGGAAAARYAVVSVLRRRDRGELGVLLGGFVVRWALIIVGLLVAATIVFPSIQPTDLLATLGIGSVAIGFAFKDILQNWLSGLLIPYRQPFRPSD